jgi:hypothetical protein
VGFLHAPGRQLALGNLAPVLTVVVECGVAERPDDQVQCLLGAPFRLIQRHAEGIQLQQSVAARDGQLDPAVGEDVGRGGLLRDQYRVDCRHEPAHVAQLDPIGSHRHRREQHLRRGCDRHLGVEVVL